MSTACNSWTRLPVAPQSEDAAAAGRQKWGDAARLRQGRAQDPAAVRTGPGMEAANRNAGCRSSRDRYFCSCNRLAPHGFRGGTSGRFGGQVAAPPAGQPTLAGPGARPYAGWRLGDQEMTQRMSCKEWRESWALKGTGGGKQDVDVGACTGPGYSGSQVQGRPRGGWASAALGPPWAPTH